MFLNEHVGREWMLQLERHPGRSCDPTWSLLKFRKIEETNPRILPFGLPNLMVPWSGKRIDVIKPVEITFAQNFGIGVEVLPQSIYLLRRPRPDPAFRHANSSNLLRCYAIAASCQTDPNLAASSRRSETSAIELRMISGNSS